MQIYHREQQPNSKPILVLTIQKTGWDTEKFIFHLIENGEIIDQMDALDVYEKCPTHPTFKEFIDHWQSEQEMPHVSTINLAAGFNHNKPTKRYSREDGE